MKVWCIESFASEEEGKGAFDVRYYRSQEQFDRAVKNGYTRRPGRRGWRKVVTVLEEVSQEVIEYEELYNPDGTSRRQHV